MVGFPNLQVQNRRIIRRLILPSCSRFQQRLVALQGIRLLLWNMFRVCLNQPLLASPSFRGPVSLFIKDPVHIRWPLRLSNSGSLRSFTRNMPQPQLELRKRGRSYGVGKRHTSRWAMNVTTPGRSSSLLVSCRSTRVKTQIRPRISTEQYRTH